MTPKEQVDLPGLFIRALGISGYNNGVRDPEMNQKPNLDNTRTYRHESDWTETTMTATVHRDEPDGLALRVDGKVIILHVSDVEGVQAILADAYAQMLEWAREEQD